MCASEGEKKIVYKKLNGYQQEENIPKKMGICLPCMRTKAGRVESHQVKSAPGSSLSNQQPREIRMGPLYFCHSLEQLHNIGELPRFYTPLACILQSTSCS